jgi:phospholipid/cholesterol/gamma-HCH transport system substrate-binding protein
VIRTSEVSIEEITALMRKIETLVDSLNSKKGTAGQLINDPALYRRSTRIADDLQTITGNRPKATARWAS